MDGDDAQHRSQVAALYDGGDGESFTNAESDMRDDGCGCSGGERLTITLSAYIIENIIV